MPREAGFMASFGIDNFQAIGPEYEAFPFFGISGFGSVGDAGYRPATYPDMVEKYQDNLSWVHGKHTIVVGADMQFYQNLRIMAPVSLEWHPSTTTVNILRLRTKFPTWLYQRPGGPDAWISFGGNRTQRFIPTTG